MKGIKGSDITAIEKLFSTLINNLEVLKEGAVEYKAQRSEKWAESEAGDEYENKIDYIEELTEELQHAADDFSDTLRGD